MCRLLASSGIAWFEHGHHQGSEIQRIANAAGLTCEILHDQFGRERFAKIQKDISDTVLR